MSSTSSKTRQSMNPHGNLSIEELTSIKIVDRCSCYVIGLDAEIATEQIFGRFGNIKFIRIIHDQQKIPYPVHIKFDNESSAEAAINWCQNQNINADHGYWKYCMQFVHNKICEKLNCRNKHSWCKYGDVIIDSNKDNKAIRENSSHQNKTNDMNKTEQMNTLQQQFMALQGQYNQGNELIHNLLEQIETFKLKNKKLMARRTMLKSQNKKLMSRRNILNDESSFNNDYTDNIKEMVDAVIRNNEENISYSVSEHDTSPTLK